MLPSVLSCPSPARQAQKFMDEPDTFLAQQRTDTVNLPPGGDRTTAIVNALGELRVVEKMLKRVVVRPTIADCVALAFQYFHHMFRDRIVDLITLFPEDYKVRMVCVLCVNQYG